MLNFIINSQTIFQSSCTILAFSNTGKEMWSIIPFLAPSAQQLFPYPRGLHPRGSVPGSHHVKSPNAEEETSFLPIKS